jgi:hypothetical protein
MCFSGLLPDVSSGKHPLLPALLSIYPGPVLVAMQDSISQGFM